MNKKKIGNYGVKLTVLWFGMHDSYRKQIKFERENSIICYDIFQKLIYVMPLERIEFPYYT